VPGAPAAVTRTVMSRIEAAMLLGVDAVVDQFEHGVGIQLELLLRSLRRRSPRREIGPLGFLAVGQALQHVGIRAVALAIPAGFTAGSIAFSAAVRRGDDTREQETHSVPPGDLAAVFPAEARPN
jgi:hypothetical protein